MRVSTFWDEKHHRFTVGAQNLSIMTDSRVELAKPQLHPCSGHGKAV